MGTFKVWIPSSRGVEGMPHAACVLAQMGTSFFMRPHVRIAPILASPYRVPCLTRAGITDRRVM